MPGGSFKELLISDLTLTQDKLFFSFWTCNLNNTTWDLRFELSKLSLCPKQLWAQGGKQASETSGHSGGSNVSIPQQRSALMDGRATEHMTNASIPFST